MASLVAFTWERVERILACSANLFRLWPTATLELFYLLIIYYLCILYLNIYRRYPLFIAINSL